MPDIGCEYDFSLFQQTSYQLNFSKIPGVPFYCHSIVLPEMVMNSAYMATRFHDIALPGEKIKFTDLTVEILLDKNLTTYLQIYNWMRNLSVLNSIKTTDTSNCNVTVGPKSFIMNGVYPISLPSMTLRSNPTDADPITFTAAFAVEWFDIQ